MTLSKEKRLLYFYYRDSTCTTHLNNNALYRYIFIIKSTAYAQKYIIYILPGMWSRHPDSLEKMRKSAKILNFLREEHVFIQVLIAFTQKLHSYN